MRSIVPLGSVAESRPVRALWIEIAEMEILDRLENVEAREGLVD